MIIFAVALLAVSVYLVSHLIKVYRYRRILAKIPSPDGHWLIGNAVWLLSNRPEQMFDLLRECAKKYWPIYRFTSPYIVTIVLSQMKHLTKSNLYDFLKNWLGEGLITSTNNKWQKRRKVLTPAFHFTILKHFLTVFNDETEILIKKIESTCTNTAVALESLVSPTTLQIISETAMGMRNIDDTTKTRYRRGIRKLAEIIFRRIWKPWLRLAFVFKLSEEGRDEKSVVQFLHNLTHKIIMDRETQLISGKILTEHSYSGRKILRMLDILLMSKICANNMDYEDIREEVDTFMFAGYDTTTSAICFLLLSLANHKGIQNEVRKEIEEILGPNRVPTYNDLQQLQYTERVIKENLRLYPSVPFISRIASEDFVTYTGYQIPKGTVLHLHIFDLHRDPRIYPDPLKFNPDRFLPENVKQRHPFAYLPFSGGPRNCIGQRFAMLEIKAVICGIIRKFDLEEVDKDTDLKFIPHFMLKPRSNMRVKFVPRNSL
ncbi:cytochrome P450 4C1-like isoform X2 [Cylas formicarius]|uniref:cytochrome P450 4C1-like isoform X2 n=1 Tax=Cylas formicarius TaxID=197179 RepID=UPI00295889BB|nr:cytochrome P450 4C1-like isoform X2 [Cylas formicarius]